MNGIIIALVMAWVLVVICLLLNITSLAIRKWWRDKVR